MQPAVLTAAYIVPAGAQAATDVLHSPMTEWANVAKNMADELDLTPAEAEAECTATKTLLMWADAVKKVSMTTAGNDVAVITCCWYTHYNDPGIQHPVHVCCLLLSSCMGPQPEYHLV